MALLTVQIATVAGIVPSFVAAGAGGDTFSNTGRESLYVKNGSGASITVTINSLLNCDQGFDHDFVVTVAAGVDKVIGPFATNRFNDGGGLVGVTYSAVTTVTVAAVRTGA